MEERSFCLTRFQKAWRRQSSGSAQTPFSNEHALEVSRVDAPHDVVFRVTGRAALASRCARMCRHVLVVLGFLIIVLFRFIVLLFVCAGVI